MSSETSLPTTNGPTTPSVLTPDDGSAPPPDDRLDAGSALLRLMVGGMLVGADQLRDRLQRWEEAAHASPLGQAASPPAASSSVRHALVGLAFETETRMRRGFSTLLARAARLADDADLAYTRLTIYTRGTPLDPLRRRLDELLFLALTEVDRWTARGAREERQGRRMAEQAAVGIVDELLDYMAHNPEVRHLIEQQGTSMAESAVGEVRARTASADLWIERLAHNLLHRPTSEPNDKHGGKAQSAGIAPPSVQTAPTASATTAPSEARAANAQRSATGAASGGDADA